LKLPSHKKRETQAAAPTLDMNEMVKGWLRILYLRDRETEDHTRRVTEITLQIARRLGLPEQDMLHIRYGALLHDIGKVAIPDKILFKPGPLTEEEWQTMKRHPVVAMELFESIAYLGPALDILRSHHEKWDGSGYPDGLAGEDIPLFARIFALADVYDALTTERPYRGAWPQVDALDYIARQSGTHFDPHLAPVFIDMMLNN